jgi:peptidoglycan/xylan/chitin deacetylase (PgdA/CDA1 family)
MSRSLTQVLRRLYPLSVGALCLLWLCMPNAPLIAKPSSDGNCMPMRLPAEVRAYKTEPEPLVTISFDDASQTVYDAAFPILDSYGIPATFYFVTSLLTEQWKAQLNDLEDHGWEIGSHSRTHPNLETIDPVDLATEVGQSKSDLEAAGLTVSGFAYPYGIGAHSGAVLRQVKQHYAYARSVREGLNTPIIEQYALQSHTVTSSTSLAAMKGWVDEAIVDRQWLILLMHTIDNTGDEYSMTPADLSELASYIKAQVDAGKIATTTVWDGVDHVSEPSWHLVSDPYYATQGDLIVTNGHILWHFGSDVVSYLYDGYAWVESGKTRYYEWSGQYRALTAVSGVALEFISSDRATVHWTLSSIDGAASALSTVTLVPDVPFAEVTIADIQGTPTRVSIGQDLARRFSIDEGALVTDGSMETGTRAYGDSAQSFFAFDSITGLIRVMIHFKAKSHSEYADHAKGEFRSRPISRSDELPFTWYLGGVVFDTLELLSEAEAGTLNGGTSFYTGDDASPRMGNTGIVLDGAYETVTIPFAPPNQGTYTLSIRQKGADAGDQYSFQIDGGQVFTRTVTGTSFGYENITLRDLSAQVHVVTMGQVSGAATVDYVLLVPTSRSADTPTTVLFPDYIGNQVFSRVFCPLVLY